MTAPDPFRRHPRRAVVVLGMHRSGTSAVAGALQRLGVDFGPRLMPPTPDNPRGYFEHIDLVNLHDRLLLALGRSWDDTAPFPAGWWRDEAAFGRYRSEALDLLRRDFPTASCWGFKDPRLCRLLPWWDKLWEEVDSAPLFVLVRRPPADVAASLARREGFSAAKSHLLWLQHTLDAEQATRGRPRVLVDFTVFLADWRAALEPVRQTMGEHLSHVPRPVDDPVGSLFVDPALARSGSNDPLPRWVEQADDALRLGLKGDEAAMRLELDRLGDLMRTAESLYVPLPAEATADLRCQVDAVRRQAAWYEAEWQKARTRAEDNHSKLVAKRLEIERLKNGVSF